MSFSVDSHKNPLLRHEAVHLVSRDDVSFLQHLQRRTEHVKGGRGRREGEGGGREREGEGEGGGVVDVLTCFLVSCRCTYTQYIVYSLGRIHFQHVCVCIVLHSIRSFRLFDRGYTGEPSSLIMHGFIGSECCEQAHYIPLRQPAPSWPGLQP